MDSYDSPSPAAPSAHWPISLLALAFCLFFLVQLQETGVEAEGLSIQRKNVTNLSEDLKNQRKLKTEDQKERQEFAAQAKKQQEASEDTKKEAQEVEKAQKTSSRMAQLNQQLTEATKAFNDQKPIIEQAAKLEKTSSDLVEALQKLATDGDNDAKALMEVVARTGINVQKPADAKAEDKPKTNP